MANPISAPAFRDKHKASENVTDFPRRANPRLPILILIIWTLMLPKLRNEK